MVRGLEGSSPPGGRHDNDEDTVLTMRSQLSPLCVRVLFLWKRPFFALTPGWLTGCPPRDPSFAVYTGIIDVGEVFRGEGPHFHPGAKFFRSGFRREV